jgi:hypothetical protein
MTKFKFISAAFALTLSTGALAAVANCCTDMACCKDGADCCDHGDKAKGGDHAGHAMPNMK